MNFLEISLSAQIRYKFYGLFESPSDEWVHMSRELIEYELMIVTDGTLYIADQKEKYTLSCGEYLIMSPGLQYGYAPSQCSFYWLHFECPKMNVPHERLIEIPIRGMLKSIERFHVLFSQLNDVFITYANSDTTNFFATNIFLELYNQINDSHRVSDTSVDKLHQNIVNYIKWNRAYNVKVKDLAQQFGYHPKYLSTIFKKKEGIPLKQYLIDQTMECAKAELCNTNRTIVSIALGMGFCDGHAFSHSFKQVVGVTPTTYRNHHQHLVKNDF